MRVADDARLLEQVRLDGGAAHRAVGREAQLEELAEARRVAVERRARVAEGLEHVARAHHRLQQRVRDALEHRRAAAAAAAAARPRPGPTARRLLGDEVTDGRAGHPEQAAARPTAAAALALQRLQLLRVGIGLLGDLLPPGELARRARAAAPHDLAPPHQVVEHVPRALGLAGAALAAHDDGLVAAPRGGAAEGELGHRVDVRRAARRVARLGGLDDLRRRQLRLHRLEAVDRQRAARVDHEQHPPRPRVYLARRWHLHDLDGRPARAARAARATRARRLLGGSADGRRAEPARDRRLGRAWQLAAAARGRGEGSVGVGVGGRVGGVGVGVGRVWLAHHLVDALVPHLEVAQHAAVVEVGEVALVVLPRLARRRGALQQPRLVREQLDARRGAHRARAVGEVAEDRRVLEGVVAVGVLLLEPDAVALAERRHATRRRRRAAVARGRLAPAHHRRGRAIRHRQRSVGAAARQRRRLRLVLLRRRRLGGWRRRPLRLSRRHARRRRREVGWRRREALVDLGREVPGGRLRRARLLNGLGSRAGTKRRQRDRSAGGGGVLLSATLRRSLCRRRKIIRRHADGRPALGPPRPALDRARRRATVPDEELGECRTVTAVLLAKPRVILVRRALVLGQRHVLAPQPRLQVLRPV